MSLTTCWFVFGCAGGGGGYDLDGTCELEGIMSAISAEVVGEVVCLKMKNSVITSSAANIAFRDAHMLLNCRDDGVWEGELVFSWGTDFQRVTSGEQRRCDNLILRRTK